METWTAYGDVQVPARPSPRVTAAEVRAALIIVAALAALGVAAGLLWWAVSPHVNIVIRADGVPDLQYYGTSDFFAADGTLLFIGAAAGVLTAGFAWFAAGRWRGPIVLLALVLGGLAGGVVAWQVGRHLGLAHYERLLDSRDAGRRFAKPVDLRAKAVLLAQPFTAALTYAALAAWVARFDLGRSGVALVQPQWDGQLDEWDRYRT